MTSTANQTTLLFFFLNFQSSCRDFILYHIIYFNISIFVDMMDTSQKKDNNNFTSTAGRPYTFSMSMRALQGFTQLTLALQQNPESYIGLVASKTIQCQSFLPFLTNLFSVLFFYKGN